MPVSAKKIEDIIDVIIRTEKLSDILDMANFKDSYKSTVLLIHPDRCSHPLASDAMAKLNMLKERFEQGVVIRDDAGEFNTNDYTVRFKGDKAAIKNSCQNYNLVHLKKHDAANLIARYIPESMSMDGDELVVKLNTRAIPLLNLNLPQEHVNWILSRILEFSVYLNNMGYMHGGISPESIFVEPENHGIQVVSFYHMTRIGERVKTYSAPHKNWYPPSLFDTKIATSKVDLELAKKIAIYLLGDKSGSGVKLKKTHNEAFVNFVISQHSNFPDKFYPLNL